MRPNRTNTISTWYQRYAKYADRAFAGNGQAYTDEAKVTELERLIGQLTLKRAFLKKSCGRSKRRTTPLSCVKQK